MKKIFFYTLFLFILLFDFKKEVQSKEIINLLSINSTIVTNYDFIKYNEMLKITQNKEYSKQYILNYIINEKIKEIELDKSKIMINDDNVKKMTKNFINSLGENYNNLEKIKQDEVKQFIENSIKLNEKWNNFINIEFSKNFEFNIDEVNKIAKDNNLNKEQKERLKEIEINKKLMSFSNSLFQEIKRNYYIKFF